MIKKKSRLLSGAVSLTKLELTINQLVQFRYHLSSAGPVRSDYQRHKNRARRLIDQRIVVLNRAYNFSYGRISIRNQQTRWGSCSRDGNLNFNYRLALLPVELADYVIVHELCHLKEFNHSARFWQLVARAVPDYLDRRRQLKKIKLSLI